MKKTVIATAIVAAVGFSAYLGFRPDPTSSLSELQLANADALSDDELPTIPCRKSKTDHCSYFAYDGDGELGIFFTTLFG